MFPSLINVRFRRNKLKITSSRIFKGIGFWKFWLQVVPRCYRPRTMFRRHTNSFSSTRRPCYSPRYTRIWTEAPYHPRHPLYWGGRPVQRYPPRCLSLWKRWMVSNKLFMNFLKRAIGLNSHSLLQNCKILFK